ncbi:MAG: lysophospholipase [Candidatus Nanopelagicales bacterium]|nr:lysophospholipase [Candidatus Nanopelagicales bacterium]MCF8539065.1 lysophospholipase [Candidatus Nanopelagicales bacterium]MCF8550536.1 lysophospholipase [Candidatus Nanopelagicales bacterium]
MRSEFTLFTRDHVRIAGTHITYAQAKQSSDPLALGIVLAHGFTGNRTLDHVQKVITALREYGGVLAIDLRGHGDSGGEGTMGMDEIHDVDSAVAHARDFGYRTVATVGFSMGGSVVLRQAALAAPEFAPQAVVSVSAPGFWFYRGTRIMRVVHRLIETQSGRLALRGKGVHVTSTPWPDPPPMSPEQAVEQLTDTPLLVVHGDVDRYFPLEHAHALQRAAERSGNPNAEFLFVPGFGHAETAISAHTLSEIGTWLTAQAAADR